MNIKLKFSNAILTTFIFLFINTSVNSQDYKDYLSPYWDSYYNKNPSGITDAHQASDFISVIDAAGFIPKSKQTNGDVSLFKRALLSLDYPELKQMMITGNFYSRTKKHDDYFQLYNLTYKKISKEFWDRYCPYLIPLMNIDGTIQIK